MKESRFISQNKEKWLESENLLKEDVKSPEKLSDLFTQVVDDLSYSRTYYPHRSVRVYLNQLARGYFSLIYGGQKERKNAFKMFWFDEFPQLMIFAKRPMLISLVVFLFAVAIGVFSSMKDPKFAATILGDQYVAMTKGNIASGDPMAVYKKSHQVDMFLGITLNNLMVAFRTYVSGIFFAIGTLAVLFGNGVMVGCFQYFFIPHGLLIDSALTIWLHGTLEISAIILSGGAGLTLGSGLLFPGTYSRLQAFQISAIRSLKLMLGIAPVIVLAALIESFLTRYTEAPSFIKIMLIALSLFIIIGYFIVYPWLKSKSGFEVPLQTPLVEAEPTEHLSPTQVRNNADIIKDTFVFYKNNFNKILGPVFLVSVFMSIARFFATTLVYSRVERTNLKFISDLFYGMNTPLPVYIVVNAIGIGFLITSIMRLMLTSSQPPKKYPWLALIQNIVLSAAVLAAIRYSSGIAALIFAFSFIVFFVIMVVQQNDESNLFQAAGYSWKLVRGNFAEVVGLQFILFLVVCSFLIILSAPVVYYNIEVLKWNFSETDIWSKSVIAAIEIFTRIFVFALVVPIVVASATYLYSSLQEIESADNLKQAIGTVGERFLKKERR